MLERKIKSQLSPCVYFPKQINISNGHCQCHEAHPRSTLVAHAWISSARDYPRGCEWYACKGTELNVTQHNASGLNLITENAKRSLWILS